MKAMPPSLKRFNIFLTAFLLLCIGCEKRSILVERAEKQLPVSFPDAIYDLEIPMADYKISGVTPIYHNDSICLLQLRVDFKDISGAEKYDIMRYVYIFDVTMSEISRKPHFGEVLLPDQPLLSKEEIRFMSKKAERDRVSMYDRYIGAVMPVKKSFDGQ